MASANELAYGPIADSYASKYNIPIDVFRSAINSRSGFDPFYSGSKGDGIAAISNKSSSTNINSFNIGQQLDIAAQDLSGTYKEFGMGSWDKALNVFNGAPSDSSGDAAAVDAMGNTIGGSNNDAVANSDPNPNNPQGYLSSGLDAVKNFLTKYVYSGLLFIVGLLLILATVYVVVTKGTGDK